ncbi:hypothetical protein RGU70_12815 [Herbaspirillum sp. RTI4]|uniref:hypothetical protein n=1 Tax=Herbaspirillum sp. RTI4 TaxID=3048640 RepID=UPI002AB3E8D0|nr:hypothetical protein [Herbaspirillum sp. RTI4]MDY7579202.1 hypothetical protein [Herbaspirillum sp. RTI4]
MASIFFFMAVFVYIHYLFFEFLTLLVKFLVLKIHNKKIKIIFFKRPMLRGFIFGFIFISINYIHDVYVRAIASDCSIDKSTKDDGIYTAEVCRSPYSVIRLRIYDSKSKKLLAERNFRNIYSIDISWTEKEIWFRGRGASEEYINLPPTLSDRILAQLP